MDKYIVKIWFRVDRLIKIMRIEVSANELIQGILQKRVSGKMLYLRFEEQK